MSARQKRSDAEPSNLIGSALVAGEMPLYRDQAAEWFGHAGRYAEIARLSLEAGDLVGAETAARKLIAYTKQSTGILREMIDANAAAAMVGADHGAAERAHNVKRETSEAA